MTCTGKCKIAGFLVEYCETCGWEDGYVGGDADPNSITLKAMTMKTAYKEPYSPTVKYGPESVSEIKTMLAQAAKAFANRCLGSQEPTRQGKSLELQGAFTAGAEWAAKNALFFTELPPKKTPLTVYIAGKCTKVEVKEAISKFAEAQKRLEARGYIVINPLLLTNAEKNWDLPWKEAMKIVLPHLLTCDMVFMLPCWRESKGAKIEAELARSLDMPVLYYPGDL